MRLRSFLILATTSLAALPAFALVIPGAQPTSRNDPNGTYCREYQQDVVIGGVRRESYGTACLQPDGDWKILPSDVQQQATVNTPQIEYVEPPRYVSAPVYVAPPITYYDPAPYYGPYPYPYRYGTYSSLNLSFGNDRHYGHGRGHHHGHWNH